ncbi:MAG: CPBP family intramembrane metalloprotease [Candidatus Bathyarchaeota archaeon]|nr:MAG: CPBP family intramembrane metalloprotease [Candidatus Bathyarchaeota archaeon]
MENKPKWAAKASLACYLALICGILLGSLIVWFVLIGIDVENLPFPIAFISLPVNEAIVVGITLLFAVYKGASLRDLGLKKVPIKFLMLALIVAVPLLLLAGGISFAEEVALGPDPMANLVEESLMPRDQYQLFILIALFLMVVGPCEELAMRGFVQKGFEHSFGKGWGLLISSTLFGLLHGLNSPYAIAPTLVVGLVIGFVWQRTDGNTVATALLHGVYDSIAIAAAYYLTA